jgi:crotonobetainyl-CoA:carnitine CoA-transferase CaiB-like acyl-CoA transferase
LRSFQVSALRPFRVLELSESVAGEYCGKLLSDFGADVIKVERPGCGSPTRRLGPLASHGPVEERSGLFAFLNTNKSSVTLDVSRAAGPTPLAKLLAYVDVVIDDHPPGWLKSVGLDPAQFSAAQPNLVLCSITAYGQSPPEDRVHAEDLTVFHSSGWGYHTPSGADESKPPLKGAGRFMVSYETGLQAAMCIVAALFERESSGQGQFIDISKQQVLTSRLDYVLGQMIAGDMDVSAKRSAFDLGGPAAIFPCREGYVYFWIALAAEWEALRRLLGNPEWMNAFPERWLERECTPERVAIFRRHVAEWLKTQDRNRVSAEGQKLGLILVPINDPRDIALSSQYEFRNYFAEVTHPVLGRMKHPTVAYKLSVTPASIERPAPALGQHGAEKLAVLLGRALAAQAVG